MRGCMPVHFAGIPKKYEPVTKHTCSKCRKDRWVKANNEKRVT